MRGFPAIPIAKNELFIQELARNYGEKCKSDSIKYVPFTISSLTSPRVGYTFNENNRNAIKNSSHLKAFDISYRGI
jgi:hypothetical protein